MTTLTNLLTTPTAYAVGWALLHSLWQGALVVAGVAAGLRLARRSAPLRYLIACAGLVLMLALPVATAWNFVGTMAAGLSASASELPQAGARATAELPAAGPAGALFALEAALPWLAAAWFLGVVALSVRLIGGWAQVQILKRRGVAPAPERWQASFSALVERVGVSRPVRLLSSTRALVPAAFGWLRPVVIVPASALGALSLRQIESILAHELAHLRRWDDVVNLLQSVVDTLLFYHPGAWWLSGRIRAERENCCDDVAVAVCGDAREYARALAGLEELRIAALPALATAATGGSLLARIRRVLGEAEAAGTDAAPRTAGALVALTLALFTVFSATAAQAGEEPAQEPPAAQSEGAPPPGWAITVEEEIRIELSCDDSEKVRRCVDREGLIRVECVPKSNGPLGAFFRWLRGERKQDDDVVVIRKAPDRGEEAAAAEAARARAEREAGASAAPGGRSEAQPGEAEEALEDRESLRAQEVEKVREVRKVRTEDLPLCRDSGNR